jgi:adenosine deaminase
MSYIKPKPALGLGLRCLSLVLAFPLASSSPYAFAQTAHTALTPAEARTARAFEAARKLGSPELYSLLVAMPKGADLHMHLSGAIYAETFLAEAVKQNLCVDPTALRFVPQEPVKEGSKQMTCGTKAVPASIALLDQKLYDELIDAFSMRSFVPSAGISGHDQFFATFERFGGLKNQNGAWLDEVATRAAAQNEQYLEIMITPPFTHAASLGYKIGWPEGADKSITPDQLAKLRDQLLADGLRDEVPADRKEARQALNRRRQIEHCPVPSANAANSAAEAAAPPTANTAPTPEPAAETLSAAPSPGCGVKIHFLYQVLRGYAPQQVFAQTLLGFETANNNPDFVGINFVMPEDGRISMQDYHLQMQMLDYLHTVYPKVRISLHAGELAPGLVPPEGLSFHIREAIDLGHALRIGHGVDVLYETDAPALLKEMDEKHIMVEINLTSNDVILGVKGHDHPLHAYMAAHVLVALSTDDEGVSRIDLTHEYVRGVEDQDLRYIDLKNMARTSLEHAFLAGDSLWSSPDVFTRRVPDCAAPITPTSEPTARCSDFLKANERAAQQWELEHRFAIFEAATH